MLLQHCVSRPQIVTPALVRRTLRWGPPQGALPYI
eukprot:SM013120S27055  [mRNA]  locus=s13120:75:179:- [translate_table: standard]